MISARMDRNSLSLARAHGFDNRHLVALMVEAGHQTAIFEPSVDRASKINATMRGNSRFLGSISSDDPATFDFVVCAEVDRACPHS